MSLKQLLKSASDEWENTKQEIVNAHTNIKDIIENMIIKSIEKMNKDNLIGVASRKKYIVYEIFENTITFKNDSWVGHLDFTDDIKCEIDFSTHYRDVEMGYNPDTKLLNAYYLFKIIKKHIKPIDDVEPVFNDVTLYIGYEW